jgi:hypothetical protein
MNREFLSDCRFHISQPVGDRLPNTPRDFLRVQNCNDAPLANRGPPINFSRHQALRQTRYDVIRAVAAAACIGQSAGLYRATSGDIAPAMPRAPTSCA